MDENPIVPRRRVHVDRAEGDQISIHNDERSSLLDFFTSLYLTMVGIVINWSKLKSEKWKNKENKEGNDMDNDQSHEIIIIDDESDVEKDFIRSTPSPTLPPILTNDYNLIQPQKNANSILIDDDEEDEDLNPDTETFGQLLKNILVQTEPREGKKQYGTDLLFSSRFLSQSTYQEKYTPVKAPTKVILSNIDINDGWYKKSVINYYNQYIPQPPRAYSFIDSILPSHHVESGYLEEYQKEQNDRLNELEKARTVKSDIVITREQQGFVDEVWQSRSFKISNFQIDISSNDLQTLKDGKWLNDNVIDYYINLIIMDNKQVFGWTTHFYSTLQSKGYQGVSRWAKRKKVNLFEKEIIIVPINISNYHWALAVVDNVEKRITYYDSIESSGQSKVGHDLQDYMNNEAKRLGVASIAYECVQGKSPQQGNGSDCGVFTCTNAKLLSKRQKLSYSQKDMKIIRRRMVFEIGNKVLL